MKKKGIMFKTQSCTMKITQTISLSIETLEFNSHSLQSGEVISQTSPIPCIITFTSGSRTIVNINAITRLTSRLWGNGQWLDGVTDGQQYPTCDHSTANRQPRIYNVKSITFLIQRNMVFFFKFNRYLRRTHWYNNLE